MIDSNNKEFIKYQIELKEYIRYEKERFRLTGKNDFLELIDYNHRKLERLKSDQKAYKIEKDRHINPHQSNNNNNNNNNNKSSGLDSEINNTVRNYSGICTVLVKQPIPFADIFILNPTQIFMGKKIA
ncbi:hypothetical protein [Flavobacterium sp. LS1P3]|uniref:hypothetical protein n=1 Tax=Flavobacterium sp. LS1P3 TaxID=3401720 RepID=UPI003AABCECE